MRVENIDQFVANCTREVVEWWADAVDPDDGKLPLTIDPSEVVVLAAQKLIQNYQAVLLIPSVNMMVVYTFNGDKQLLHQDAYVSVASSWIDHD